MKHLTRFTLSFTATVEAETYDEALRLALTYINEQGDDALTYHDEEDLYLEDDSDEEE
tara:strand:+ start:624 stop:797 length:174 start_codon:yes stop_codon:yes gene_type:complete